MDPTATLTEIFKAIIEGRKDDAYDTLIELIRWTEKGGYAPDVKAALEKITLD